MAKPSWNCSAICTATARPFAWSRTTSATRISPSARFIFLTAASLKKPRKPELLRKSVRRKRALHGNDWGGNPLWRGDARQASPYHRCVCGCAGAGHRREHSDVQLGRSVLATSRSLRKRKPPRGVSGFARRRQRHKFRPGPESRCACHLLRVEKGSALIR